MGRIYRKSKELFNFKFASGDVYYMNPVAIEKKHYHKGIEFVYVLSGSCKTHKKGKLYLYKTNEVHEVVNDSPNELVFVCITIPPESDKNTVYV